MATREREKNCGSVQQWCVLAGAPDTFHAEDYLRSSTLPWKSHKKLSESFRILMQLDLGGGTRILSCLSLGEGKGQYCVHVAKGKKCMYQSSVAANFGSSGVIAAHRKGGGWRSRWPLNATSQRT